MNIVIMQRHSERMSLYAVRAGRPLVYHIRHRLRVVLPQNLLHHRVCIAHLTPIPLLEVHRLTDPTFLQLNF